MMLDTYAASWLIPRSGFDTGHAATPRSCKEARTPFQPALSANAPCTRSTVGVEALSGVVVIVRTSGPGAPSELSGAGSAPCLGGDPQIIGQPTAPVEGSASAPVISGCPPGLRPEQRER